MASHETLRENSGNIPMAPGKHTLSFDTILSQAKEWTAPDDISEAEVARSGIASILRQLDDTHTLSHGAEVQLPPLRDRALGVITRALNNGAPETMDEHYGNSIKKHAKLYEEAYGTTKKWNTKSLALAGQREVLTGVLEEYTEYLDTQEAVMRNMMARGEAKYSENTFIALYREKSDASALADIIFESGASKRAKLSSQEQKALPASSAETTVVTFKEQRMEEIRRLRMKEMQVSQFDTEYPDSDYANIMPSSSIGERTPPVVSDQKEDTIVDALTEDTHEDFRKIVPPPSDKDAA